ncbi:MAG: cobyric acid synthase [Proteobacteria bacterium]|nr:cobyric acid synthase [Pseudomonadota bacterium]MBU1716023.1 cobyric acid synthase [Pseudomonadota bacterium]
MNPQTSKIKTPSIMFQGTCSNAGKSVLTAALCRILLQDGLRVAPFKAQNMSLNSFVTRDGHEMGRAQVVQAQACRLDPDVRMNPILLKPCSDTGSQVIVNGKPVGNMKVKEYFDYKPIAFKAVCEAYDSLAADYEVIVLEGAGSPAEVNLKENDIVNMHMARYAESPVLLVGDIDRGGVFAAFVGTIELLNKWERELIAGFVVNKFRGQISVVDEALTFIHKRTGHPVLGVIDYIQNLGLPEEDSVGFKQGLFEEHRPTAGDHVTIALIDLPHISNFTDFEPFLAEPDVHLKIVKSVRELGRPDAIILPGSKNVMADMNWLAESGLAKEIVKLATERKIETIGICGGFQMLGSKIEDPHQIESDGRTITGLGLLEISTVLEKIKTLIRREDTHLESGLAVHGYEIHHGQTIAGKTNPVLKQHAEAGAASADRKIWGSYLHGIFDADPFRRWFIDRLRTGKGLTPRNKICATYDLEPAFDRLAAAFRERIDMDLIYQILKI